MKKFNKFDEFSKNVNICDVVEIVFNKKVPITDCQIHEEIPKGHEKETVFIEKVLGYITVNSEFQINLEQCKGRGQYSIIKSLRDIKEYRIYE